MAGACSCKAGVLVVGRDMYLSGDRKKDKNSQQNTPIYARLMFQATFFPLPSAPTRPDP